MDLRSPAAILGRLGEDHLGRFADTIFPPRLEPAVRLRAARTGWSSKALEAPPGFEPGNKGFAGLCLTTWLRRQ